MRPVSIGTAPKSGMMDFINYDDRTEIQTDNGVIRVWAEIYYNRELTEQEMKDYEMARESKRGGHMENITEAQKERIEKTIQRAIEQDKLENKEDAVIRLNKHGNVWLSWKNAKRNFRFTIFKDGAIHSGFLGTELEKSCQ